MSHSTTTQNVQNHVQKDLFRNRQVTQEPPSPNFTSFLPPEAPGPEDLPHAGIFRRASADLFPRSLYYILETTFRTIFRSLSLQYLSKHSLEQNQAPYTRRLASFLSESADFTINQRPYPPLNMAKYRFLTTGIHRALATGVMNPGDAFIVRFKNSVRDHKADIWIGVLLPDDFDAPSGLNRRPKGAKPLSGEWETDLGERVYPAYLPGRNTSRWIRIIDFFVLENKIPSVFTRTVEGRDYTKDIKIYRELLKIVDRKPSVEFWLRMAKTESLVKGKRDKRVGLVLPDGFDEITEGISTLSDENLEEDDRYSSSVLDDESGPVELEGEPPSKVQAFKSSFSGSRALAESSGQNRESPRSLTFPGENKPFPSFHAGKHELAGSSCLGKRKSAPDIRKTPVPVQDSQTKTEKEPDEGINNALVDLHKTLFERSWTLTAMIEHILLEKESSQALLAILRDVSTVQKPESGKLVSFLKTSEFAPQLLKVSNAGQTISGETEEYEIGDCLGIHRQFQLHGVTNSADLHEQIMQLGGLYHYARRLYMVDLVEKITFKLQAAWNSYPGLSQLEPLLDVTELVFKDFTWNDHLQDWLIKFIADTQDLIYYQCPQRFWAIMREKNDLYNSVTQMRSEFNRKNPERYANPREQIRQRGIVDF